MSPNVLQFRGDPGAGRRAGLLRIVVIDEGDVFALKVDRAVLAEAVSRPASSQTCKTPNTARPTEPGMGQPFLAVDEGRAGALSCRRSIRG